MILPSYAKWGKQNSGPIKINVLQKYAYEKHHNELSLWSLRGLLVGRVAISAAGEGGGVNVHQTINGELWKEKKNAAASIDGANTGRVIPVTAAPNTSNDHKNVRLKPRVSIAPLAPPPTPSSPTATTRSKGGMARSSRTTKKTTRVARPICQNIIKAHTDRRRGSRRGTEQKKTRLHPRAYSLPHFRRDVTGSTHHQAVVSRGHFLHLPHDRVHVGPGAQSERGAQPFEHRAAVRQRPAEHRPASVQAIAP